MVARDDRGRSRFSSARAVSPRGGGRRFGDLIIVRHGGGETARAARAPPTRACFHADRFVFPGGRLDPADSRTRPHRDLDRKSARETPPAHAWPGQRSAGRGLAVAAIRETFEETGLLLAGTGNGAVRTGSWRELMAADALLDLSVLRYFARAITPPAAHAASIRVSLLPTPARSPISTTVGGIGRVAGAGGSRSPKPCGSTFRHNSRHPDKTGTPRCQWCANSVLRDQSVFSMRSAGAGARKRSSAYSTTTRVPTFTRL